MRVRREVVATLAAVVLTACSAAAAGSPDVQTTDLGPDPTVGGVGVLPPAVSVSTGDATADTTEASADSDPSDSTDDARGVDETDGDPSVTTSTRPSSTTTTSTIVEAPTVTIGEQVMGNKVLMIGDSILASTSRRYGRNMCNALEPLGWQVAVEAEVSREISFGNRVLRSKLSAGWDAAVILLGNNYGKNPNVFMAELDKMLVALAPRPVLLLTVTEFEEVQREVNDIIRAVGALYPNVTVVEWGAASLFPGVLSGDNLHLTDAGREFLAQIVAPYFGTAPVQPGACLSSTFHDDSAGSVNGPVTTTKPGGNKPPTTTARPTSTTKPPTTTTRPPMGTGTTAPSQTNPPQQTSPPQTSPPPTSPPQTSPPQTSPPQTSPPQTSPPQTLPVTLPRTDG